MKRATIKVKTSIKGGRLAGNHVRNIKVKAGLKGGRLAGNHSRNAA